MEESTLATKWTNPPLGQCMETIMQFLSNVDIAACRAISKEWNWAISQTLWELNDLDTTGLPPRLETLTALFPNVRSLSLHNITTHHINQLPVINNIKLIKLKLASAPTKHQLSCKLLVQLSSVQELSLHNFTLTNGEFLKKLPSSIIKLTIDNCVVEVFNDTSDDKTNEKEVERDDSSSLPPSPSTTVVMDVTQLLSHQMASSLQSLCFTNTIKLIRKSTLNHQHTDNQANHQPYYHYHHQQQQQYILPLLPPPPSPEVGGKNNKWSKMKKFSLTLGASGDNNNNNNNNNTVTLDQICLNITNSFPHLQSLHMEASPFLLGSRLSPSGIEGLPHLLSDLKILDQRGLSGSTMRSIARYLTHLKTLDISLDTTFPHSHHGSPHVDDVVNAASLRELSALQHLTSLRLTFCDMSLSVCQNIAKLTALQHLELGKCCSLQDCGLFALGALTTSLTSLALSGCCSITDIGIIGLAKQCRNLQSLDLTGCHRNITDTGLAALGCILTHLTCLSLAHCDAITDAGLEAFLLTSAATSHHHHHHHHHHYDSNTYGGRSPLTKLNISDCFRLTDRSAFLLAFRAPALEWLSVEHCPMIGDRGLTALCCRHYSQSPVSTPFKKKHYNNNNKHTTHQHSLSDNNNNNNNNNTNMCRLGRSSLTEVYTFGSGVSHEGVESVRDVMRRKLGRPIRLYTTKSCWWGNKN
jgi:hypothetical protein